MKILEPLKIAKDRCEVLLAGFLSGKPKRIVASFVRRDALLHSVSRVMQSHPGAFHSNSNSRNSSSFRALISVSPPVSIDVSEQPEASVSFL